MPLPRPLTATEFDPCHLGAEVSDDGAHRPGVLLELGGARDGGGREEGHRHLFRRGRRRGRRGSPGAVRGAVPEKPWRYAAAVRKSVVEGKSVQGRADRGG